LTLLETIRRNGYTLYPCKNKCGNYIRGKDSFCRSCYNKIHGLTIHLIKIKHTKYPCKTCGKLIYHKNGTCRDCYNKESSRTTGKVLRDKHDKKRYPCKQCGTPIVRPTGLCRDCYNKNLRKQAELRQVEVNKRKEERYKRLKIKDNTHGLIICPNNPNGGSHIEIIDENKIGKCKFCGRTKDYNKLQEQYIGAMGY